MPRPDGGHQTLTMARPSDPLLNSAMRVLEVEAIDNDAARDLLELLDSIPSEVGWAWSALEILSNFRDGAKVQSRHVFIACLLKELSALHPVPMLMLH